MTSEAPSAPPKLRRLHIGCNETRLPGFVNVDARRTGATDVVHSCENLAPFADRSAELIFANAFLEHLRSDRRACFLAEAERVLAPGGILYLSGIPDFEQVARAYLGRVPFDGGAFDLAHVYRYTHGAPEEEPQWWLEQLHKSLFDAPTLAALVERAGFNDRCIFRYAWGTEPQPVNLAVVAAKASAHRLTTARVRELVDELAPVNRVRGPSIRILSTTAIVAPRPAIEAPRADPATTASSKCSSRLALAVNVRNEASALEALFASTEGVDEVVVADMESTDGTAETARRHGARVLSLPNAGYCEPGRQPLLDAVESDWILLLDADERLSPDGLAVLRAGVASAPDDVAAFTLERRTFIGATRLYASGWDSCYERHVRVFRRGRVTWPAHLHAVPTVHGVVAHLPGDVVWMDHLNFEDVERFIQKTNRYSTIEARELLDAGAAPSAIAGLRDGLDELSRRYAPEDDGALSLAMGFGIFAYRLLRQLKASEAEGWPEEELPSRAALRRAIEAFWEAARTESIRARPRGAAAAGDGS
jgi:SAM-dependent methyltransferase